MANPLAFGPLAAGLPGLQDINVKGPGLLGRVGQGLVSSLQDPLFQLGLGLLEQGGTSRTPVSFGQGFARAGQGVLANQQRQQSLSRQADLDALSKRFRESQIRKNNASARNPNPSGKNVQGQFVTEDGFLGFLRRDGTVEVTDQKIDQSFQFVSRPDGSTVAVNKNDPAESIPVVSSEEALEQTRKSEVAKIEGRTGAEKSAAAPQALANFDKQIDAIDAALEQVNFAETLVSPLTTGFVGSATRGIPGTPSFDLDRAVDTVKAELAFGRLQQMRDSSKSGGALGQVSERELTLLESAVTSLDTAQTQAGVLRALKRVDKHYSNFKRQIEIDRQVIIEGAGGGSSNRIRFDASGNPI